MAFYSRHSGWPYLEVSLLGSMLLFAPQESRKHFWCGIAVLSVTLAAVAWYCFKAAGASRLPGGSSGIGLIYGSIAAAIIGFEMLLMARKAPWVRAWRIGATRHWMLAHIWLGLLCVPFAVLHTGLQLGGVLTSTLAVLFIVVIASGVYGLWLQNRLPQEMRRLTPAETVFGQIEQVTSQYAVSAAMLVSATCGPKDGHGPSPRAFPATADTVKAQRGMPVVGAPRAWSQARNRLQDVEVPRQVVPHAEPLREAFEAEIEPYLMHGNRARPASRLTEPQQAAEFFRGLRTRLEPGAHPAVDALETWCDHRRQFDLQLRLHRRLHAWLVIHLPLSFALVFLLAAHVYTSLKYW